MTRALYNAMSGALAHAHAVDVTAHNVANAGTAGYRAQRATFAEVLGTDTPGVAIADTLPDVRPGEVRRTDNPLDLALSGDGYFVLGAQDGPLFTRAGAFRLDDEGTLVAGDGVPVMSRGGGTVQVPPNAKTVAIGADGVVSADGLEVGQVLVAQVAQADLRAEGSRLRAVPDAVLREMEDPGIQSGALEGSNFQVVRGMVELIRASRAYEAATRTIQTVSDTERRTARGFGSAG